MEQNATCPLAAKRAHSCTRQPPGIRYSCPAADKLSGEETISLKNGKMNHVSGPSGSKRDRSSDCRVGFYDQNAKNHNRQDDCGQRYFLFRLNASEALSPDVASISKASIKRCKSKRSVCRPVHTGTCSLMKSVCANSGST